MIPMLVLVAVARGEDPPAATPVATTPPAVAPAPTTPTLETLAGTWYVTSPVAGKEAVAWSCTSHPDSFDFDEGHMMIGVGAQSYGGSVTSTTSGETLVLKTTMEACRSTKNVTVKWADAAHHILDITRCVGTPSRVRAVRDVSSGVPVLRQCCDTAGKALKYVATDEPCPAGSVGQKPVPLSR